MAKYIITITIDSADMTEVFARIDSIRDRLSISMEPAPLPRVRKPKLHNIDPGPVQSQEKLNV